MSLIILTHKIKQGNKIHIIPFFLLILFVWGNPSMALIMCFKFIVWLRNDQWLASHLSTAILWFCKKKKAKTRQCPPHLDPLDCTIKGGKMSCYYSEQLLSLFPAQRMLCKFDNVLSIGDDRTQPTWRNALFLPGSLLTDAIQDSWISRSRGCDTLISKGIHVSTSEAWGSQ